MTMAQTWAIIGSLIGTLATLIAVTYRSMSLHGRAMTDAVTNAVDGLRHETHAGLNGLRNEMHEGLNGLRNETHEGLNGLRNETRESFNGLRNETRESFNGLRNEMVARFEGVDRRFDTVEGQLTRLASLDREVHALTLKVFGDKPPDSS